MLFTYVGAVAKMGFRQFFGCAVDFTVFKLQRLLELSTATVTLSEIA